MTKRTSAYFLAAAVVLGSWAPVAALAADPMDTCVGCHAKDGISTDTKVPTIAGMSVKYLTSTLGDYQKKTRPCPEATVLSGPQKGNKTDMCKVTTDLSAADIDKVAKSYSAMKYAHATQTFDAALAAKGKAIHDKLCEKCHTESGTVPDDDAGFLGGEMIGYLTAQMDDYKAAKRPMPLKMQPKIDEVQPGDIPALVNYYASVK
jgi:sulfide dehydrogenase cytochrome subunit